MADKYRIELIDSMEKWDNMAESWNILLSQSISNTIFLTCEWLLSWAETYIDDRRKLFILSIYDNDELVGIAPWYINNISLKLYTLKQIEFIGTPEAGSDYLEVIIKKGKEKEVIEYLYDFLLDEGSSLWDCFLLRDIPSESLFLLHLLSRIEDDGKYVEIRRGSFCPIAFLPKDKDDFLPMLSPNRREQFRRHWKVLKQDSTVNHRSYLSEDIEEGLREFFNLYREKSGYWNKQFDLFVQKFASRSKNKGSIQIDFLSVNGNNIAGLLHLRYQNTLFMYLMAVDKAFNPKISIGNVLVGMCINKAIDDGFSHYDFLKGTEHYKFHWTNSGKSSVNIIFYQKKIIPILLVMKKFITYTAKIILR